jgi:hypothetical protein
MTTPTGVAVTGQPGHHAAVIAADPLGGVDEAQTHLVLTVHA